MTKPVIAAMKEAIKMAIFEFTISESVSNAKSVMKMDIVKPIPPNIPAPKMFFQCNPFGKMQSPKVTPKYERNHIPKGFPMINPRIIPILLECVKPSYQLEFIIIQVFANANKGKFITATGLCRKCCNL